MSLQNEAMRRFRDMVDDFVSLSNSLPYNEGQKVEALLNKLLEYDELQEQRVKLAMKTKAVGV